MLQNAKQIPVRVARRPGGRSARIRRAVFDATLDILAREGYGALTIEAVADAAGVNKTTVYRNWPSKAALLLAAAKDRSEAVIVTRSTGDRERDLVTFLRSVLENITSPFGRALVIATLRDAENTDARAARDEFWGTRFRAAREFIRRVMDDGRPDAEVDAFVERLVAPLYLRVFITGAPVGDGFIRETVRAALRHESG
jgi:AcrR family transcriptional regulator